MKAIHLSAVDRVLVPAFSERNPTDRYPGFFRQARAYCGIGKHSAPAFRPFFDSPMLNTLIRNDPFASLLQGTDIVLEGDPPHHFRALLPWDLLLARHSHEGGNRDSDPTGIVAITQ